MTSSPRHVLAPFSIVRTVALSLSLAVLVSCGSEGDGGEDKQEEQRPTGFTDHSGVLVATLLESPDAGDHAHTVTLAVHDPQEEQAVAELSAGEIVMEPLTMTSMFGTIDELLTFSPDYSHLAYKSNAEEGGDILLYRLEGQEGQAELVRELPAPDDAISGAREYGGLEFQSDGDRLWYSIEGDGEVEVESVGIEGEDEPQGQGTVSEPESTGLVEETANWAPGEDGDVIEYEEETTETEVEGGTATTTYLTDGDATHLQRVALSTDDSTRMGPEIDYQAIHPLDERTYLAGGELAMALFAGTEVDHEWGPLMEFTLDDDGAITDQEVVVPETEKSGVTGLQASPDGSQAVLALGDEDAAVAEFYHMNLAESAEPAPLDGLTDYDPEEAGITDEVPQLGLVGWLD